MKFVINGKPIAQARPQFTTHGGFSRAYDPAKSRRAKADVLGQVKMAMRTQSDFKPLENAIELNLTFYRPIPKGKSKKWRENAKKGVILPTSRPDVDNYAKLIKDALNGYLWRDDSQVTDLIARKRYSDTPRIEIEVQEIVIDEQANINA